MEPQEIPTEEKSILTPPLYAKTRYRVARYGAGLNATHDQWWEHPRYVNTIAEAEELIAEWIKVLRSREATDGHPIEADLEDFVIVKMVVEETLVSEEE